MLHSLSKPEKWIWSGIPALFFIGSVTHFLFELSGKNLFLGLFVPVNESVWEHIKLVVLPCILWWSTLYILSPKAPLSEQRKWFGGAVAALCTSVLMVPALYYLYTGAFGVELLWADILILFLSVSAGQLLGLHCYHKGKGISPWSGIVIFIGFIALFGIFTFVQPHIPLFFDHMAGHYGP